MMSGEQHCRNCTHFVAFRPFTQIVAAELGTDDEAVTSELARHSEEERSRQESEAMLRVQLMRSETEHWPVRPMMSDYCGLALKDERWLVCEVKNAGGQCRDYKEGAPPYQPCTSCRWRAAAIGRAREQAEFNQQRQLMEAAAYTGQGGDSGFERFLARFAAKKRYEIAQALRFGEFSHAPPEYLATCRRYSDARTHVPACIQNPSHRCAGFEPVETCGAAGFSRPSWIVGGQS